MRRSYEFEGIVSLVIGVLLIFLPVETILSILQFILGGYLIFAFFPATLIAFSTQRGFTFLKISSLLMMVLGIVIMFFGFNFIGSIIGVVLLSVLLVNLINSQNKLETFKKDLVKYIISLVLVFLGINIVLHIGIRVIGILLIVIGIIALIANSRNKSKPHDNFDNNNFNNSQTLNEDVIDVDFSEDE